MRMNESELNALVEARLEAELAARLAADRERVRMEVVSELRREAERKHYDRINSKHPVEDRYGGLGAEGHAARLKAMDARARAEAARLDAINQRPVPGTLAHQRSLIPGSEGITVRAAK
jgi:hypothetical protein